MCFYLSCNNKQFTRPGAKFFYLTHHGCMFTNCNMLECFLLTDKRQKFQPCLYRVQQARAWLKECQQTDLRSSERISSCLKGVWGNSSWQPTTTQLLIWIWEAKSSSLGRQPPKSLMPTYSVTNLKGKLYLAHITSQVTNKTRFSVTTPNTHSSPLKEQEPMKHDAML